MSTARVLNFSNAGPPVPSVQVSELSQDLRPLGQILLEDSAIDDGLLFKAVLIQQRDDIPLGEILLANGWVDERALARALARQWRTAFIDLALDPPDARLIDRIGAAFCVAYAVVPWRRVAGVTYIAAAQPTEFRRVEPELTAALGRVRMVLASDPAIRDAVLSLRRTQLVRQAEYRVPKEMSCRTRKESRTGLIALGALALVTLGLITAPVLVLMTLTAWATFTLAASMVLKVLSFQHVLRKAAVLAPDTPIPDKLPIISVMVPLFREADIADRLVTRLSRLHYPRELTDIVLVVEEGDAMTRDALGRAALPRWMRVVSVPDGPIRTKPRALNYARHFCKGSIIGIWDAEDRPDPDQLHKVARRFAVAPPNVACLQGVLDYYNPRTNWLARCFTIEYAAWFRTNLPGVERLGLIVPLGGTTLFFRRHLLEKAGCWDAWNVTEDCDLGVRLARMGLRTEMLDTVTLEEANCRLLPWVKQRSRWLKGFLMTWGVHMRSPRLLWTQIGPAAFLAMQIQVLFSVTQYLLAPILWSFWLLCFGFGHPVRSALSGVWNGWAVTGLFTLFVASELLNIAIAAWAVRGPKHRHLWPWVPTMHFYYPLGCLAGWKAIYEIVVKPFYWDKTVHGVFDGVQDANDALPSPAVQAGGMIPVMVLEEAKRSAMPVIIAPTVSTIPVGPEHMEAATDQPAEGAA
ncbi:MAG: glycosyl transferase [Paracoccus denitrificans]|nr:MAG: glycosyl transferase [Paracoccus denitrificans]PZO84632.1 MAG: glycosyl transferase [Paracoccus denitrificans]